MNGGCGLCGVVWAGALLWSLAGAATCAESSPPTSRAAEAGTEETRRLIERLADGSFAVRAEAERDLMGIGPAVLALLREASGGEDLEVALRARRIIETLRGVWLLGATVELSASRTRVRWNEPFALKVRVQNRSSEPCRTPFGPATTGGWSESPNVRQVVAMLEAANFLRVVGPQGREIELHTEPIGEDPAVEQAVRRLAEYEATDVLEGGSRQEFELRGFNRGWSRYRMLEAGRYTIRFAYEPSWEDAELSRRRVGRVLSEAVTVTVTEPAPLVVRRGSQELTCEVVRQGEQYVAYATNTGDWPRRVNTNWGSNPRRRARLSWYFLTEGGALFEYEPIPARAAFSLERIVAVEPGRRVELARVSRREVIEALGEEGELSEEGAHGLVYTNLLRRGAPGGERGAVGAEGVGERPGEQPQQLPPHIFTGRVSCVPAADRLLR